MAAQARGTILQAVHDIRSPLSALRILMRQQQEEVPTSQRELMQAVVQRIEQIADDLLKQTRDPEMPKTRSLYCALVSLVGEKALEWGSGVTIDYALDARLASRRVDTRDLLRALSNLINNAAEAGARRVVLEVEDSGGLMRFRVSDDGLGMTDEMVESVMQAPGGLGLAHARSFVRRLRGEFSLESRLGEGTCVTLLLPPVF